jgi:uncharacterized membrane protein YecN with MAPEG domain
MTQAYIVTPYAAVLGLLGAALTLNVIRNRGRANATAGDGGSPALAQAIRAHGNFIEQTPLTLLVILLAEASGARPLMIHLYGAGLVASRLAAALALTRTLGLTRVRVFGAALGILVLAAASITALTAWLRLAG